MSRRLAATFAFPRASGLRVSETWASLRTAIGWVSAGLLLLASGPALAAAPASPTPAVTTPRIAIIIDDIGYSKSRGEQVMALPAPLTCSVIPRAPHAHQLGFDAYQHGKEVIIHLPMPALDGRKLDPGDIDASMSTAQIGAILDQAMAVLPEARGINNHMGSALTAQRLPMQRLMQELHQRHLFFIDSRTSSATVAEQVAQQMGVRTNRRDVFLDDKRNQADIDRQFETLLRLARRHGQAIAIGHPYPETIRYLRQKLPTLKESAIRVVPVSALLPAPQDEAVPAAQKDRPGMISATVSPARAAP